MSHILFKILCIVHPPHLSIYKWLLSLSLNISRGYGELNCRCFEMLIDIAVYIEESFFFFQIPKVFWYSIVEFIIKSMDQLEFCY